MPKLDNAAASDARAAERSSPEIVHAGELEFPISFAQQRLWLLDRLLPLGSAYNVSKLYGVRGELDCEALRGALDDLLERHESRRTRFGFEESGPVQLIAARQRMLLEVEDLGALEATEREAQARRRAQAEALVPPFDLERGPLIRGRLRRLSEREHWLLLTLHHIITDGWSSGVLARELSELYGARLRGEKASLSALPVQYADYAVWQREWLRGEVLELQLGYWKPALAELPVLELPSDRPRPAVASFRGGRLSLAIDAELTRRLKELGRSERATLFMTLLAAFQVLLYRDSGQEDIAVGAPIAGRVRPELGGSLGFSSTRWCCVGTSRGIRASASTWRGCGGRALEAYAHQDLPFEKLVEELHPKRDGTPRRWTIGARTACTSSSSGRRRARRRRWRWRAASRAWRSPRDESDTNPESEPGRTTPFRPKADPWARQSRSGVRNARSRSYPPRIGLEDGPGCQGRSPQSRGH